MHTRTEKNSGQGGNWTHYLWVRSPLLCRLGYKVRREQAVGAEDVKVTAMNMCKYKEGLRFCKRWPCISDRWLHVLNKIRVVKFRYKAMFAIENLYTCFSWYYESDSVAIHWVGGFRLHQRKLCRRELLLVIEHNHSPNADRARHKEGDSIMFYCSLTSAKWNKA